MPPLLTRPISTISTRVSHLPKPTHTFSNSKRHIQKSYSTMVRSDPFQPAKRVAGQKQDVW